MLSGISLIWGCFVSDGEEKIERKRWYWMQMIKIG